MPITDSSAAVFIIVGGQPATDDRCDDGGYLANTVARLETELSRVRSEQAKSLDEIAKLKGELSVHKYYIG